MYAAIRTLPSSGCDDMVLEIFTLWIQTNRVSSFHGNFRIIVETYYRWKVHETCWTPALSKTALAPIPESSRIWGVLGRTTRNYDFLPGSNSILCTTRRESDAGSDNFASALIGRPVGSFPRGRQARRLNFFAGRVGKKIGSSGVTSGGGGWD